MATVFGVSPSPFVRKVRVVLAEKNVPYELAPVFPGDADAKFRAMSPLGKIPAFKDGERTLCDSSIICSYLERVHPTPALYPQDPYDCARALWQHAGLAYPALPTGNGFCLYIRRSVIDAVGLLDEAAFPQGYGEENDFCQRASHRGLRHLICLGRGAGRLSLSVLPLQDGLGRTAQALLVLGKRNLCGELPMLAFAREHQLTAAEQQVLQALCAGLQPQEIAQRHGVAISTVRTQIASVRAKTATESIRDLVAMVAQLPPMQGVLRVVELR